MYMNELIIKINSSIAVYMNEWMIVSSHLSLIDEQLYATINIFKFIRILQIMSTRTN